MLNQGHRNQNESLLVRAFLQTGHWVGHLQTNEEQLKGQRVLSTYAWDK